MTVYQGMSSVVALGWLKLISETCKKVWKHSSLHWTRKLEIYKALIESKLMYSLSCLCLSVADRCRLDGFRNRCLRRILGIPPAFISRVSNAEVRRQAHCHAATDLLLHRQLLLFGKAFRSPPDSPMHSNSFIPGTLQPVTNAYVRRVGRPRREWITEVRNKAFQFVGDHREIARLVHNPFVWRHAVCQFLRVHAPPEVVILNRFPELLLISLVAISHVLTVSFIFASPEPSEDPKVTWYVGLLWRRIGEVLRDLRFGSLSVGGLSRNFEASSFPKQTYQVVVPFAWRFIHKLQGCMRTSAKTLCPEPQSLNSESSSCKTKSKDIVRCW